MTVTMLSGCMYHQREKHNDLIVYNRALYLGSFCFCVFILFHAKCSLTNIADESAWFQRYFVSVLSSLRLHNSAGLPSAYLTILRITFCHLLQISKPSQRPQESETPLPFHQLSSSLLVLNLFLCLTLCTEPRLMCH